MEPPFNVVAAVPAGVDGMVALMRERMAGRVETLREALYAVWLPAPYDHQLIVSDGAELMSLEGCPFNDEINVMVSAQSIELFELMKVLDVPMAFIKNDVWDEAIATHIPPAT